MTAHAADGLADSDGLLRFWFDEAGPARWFAVDPAFDETLRRQFGALYEAAASGALDDWADRAGSALALVIALDQLPRNLFRGTARAFATDAKARAVADTALASGLDTVEPPQRRVFFYLPFMHSELATDQDRSVALFRTIRAAQQENFSFALEHRDVIARFGRFPTRNAALNRPSSREETAFLRTFSGF